MHYEIGFAASLVEELYIITFLAVQTFCAAAGCAGAKMSPPPLNGCKSISYKRSAQTTIGTFQSLIGLERAYYNIGICRTWIIPLRKVQYQTSRSLISKF